MRLKDGHGATFFEKSDLEGLHRLKLQKTLFSAEQQYGFQGFFESFMIVAMKVVSENGYISTMVEYKY